MAVSEIRSEFDDVLHDIALLDNTLDLGDEKRANTHFNSLRLGPHRIAIKRQSHFLSLSRNHCGSSSY